MRPALYTARRSLPVYGVYALVALAVMAPWLQPGFILTLDMVFTPVLRMPESVTSSWPFHALLHALNLILPADVLQKILLCTMLILAGTGMHRLLGTIRVQPVLWARYAAGILYMVNPFTYSRLVTGQYAVLLGYALLPWFVRRLLLFARQPGPAQAAALAAVAVLIGIVSIHTLGAVGILAAVAAATAAWRRRNLRTYALYAGMAIAIFIAGSSYWLVPLALGQGKTAQTIQSFSAADGAAFAAIGESAIGRLGNIIRLQGFWAEDRLLYTLPQEQTVAWGLMALCIIALATAGFAWLWPRSPGVVALLGLAAATGALFAAGFAGGLLAGAGLREPHKLVGLVALAYSVGLAYGVHRLLEKSTAYGRAAYAATTTATILLPVLFTHIMFWGASGQLALRSYPAGWQAANKQLREDRSDFAVLFLPWHQYMSFSFSERIIANPAPAYFDKPVIASKDPAFKGASSGRHSPVHNTVVTALRTGQGSEVFGRQLASQNIKYILLAKEADHATNHLIATTPGLRLVRDYHDIAVYKNTAWRQP